MPTTTIPTAIAVSSAVQSSMAFEESHEANVRSCVVFIDAFNNKISSVRSVQEMHEYSNCVNTVYPNDQLDIQVNGKLLVGSFMLMMLLSIIIGIIVNKNSRLIKMDCMDWMGALFIAPVIGSAAWLIGLGIYYGILYLFS